MAKLFRVRALGICLSGSKPPTRPISASGLPQPHTVSQLYTTHSLYAPHHLVLMATQYRVRALGVCFSGSTTPPPPDLCVPASHHPRNHISTNTHTSSTTTTLKFQWPGSTERTRSVSPSQAKSPDLCIPTTHYPNQHIIPDPYTPSMTTALQSQWLGSYHVHSLVIGLADQNTCPAQSRPRYTPSPQLEDIHHPKHRFVVYRIVVHGALLKHSVGYFHVVERLPLGPTHFRIGFHHLSRSIVLGRTRRKRASSGGRTLLSL